ncbi:MAG: diaminopimelate decarboxylase [Candidatus Micrarchaeota archaeon]
MQLMPPLTHENNSLQIGKIPISEIYEQFGPGAIYAYDANRIIQNFKNLKSAFTDSKGCFSTKISFAIKSNSNPAIMQILQKEGCGADCSSLNEIKIAQMAGVQNQHILYSGNNNPIPELKYAIKNNLAINFDSISLFERASKDENISEIPVCFRYNPQKGLGENEKITTAGKGSKFGIPESEIASAYKSAKQKGAKRFGLHMMSGSNTREISPFISQIDEQLKIAGQICSELQIEFEFINIGGGFGVPYKPEDPPLNLQELGSKICEAFASGCQKYGVRGPNSKLPSLMLEPGRIIVADSGIILAQITNIKNSEGKRIIGLDASMATLLRPALYGSYHQIYINGHLHEETSPADIVGQACESSDFFAKARPIPNSAKEGDIAVICTAGAYGFSMSSNYCNMQRAAEVLILNSQLHLIREKQTFEQMLISTHLLP